MDTLLELEATPTQRLLLLWAFVVVGLVICVQLSQTQSDEPLQWSRLTSSTRRYWVTVYVLEAFLLVQNTYPILLESMEGYAYGHEERILNIVWVGLLAVEVAMVLGVAVQSAVKRVTLQTKHKNA